MRNPCAFTLSLSLALALASIGFLGMPLAAQAALYLPGATLDPACAPTDPNCGISTIVASSSANNVPYYANNGSTLSSTSSLQILPNGTASTTNLIVTNSLTLGTLSGFLKATAGALATALINLASDVTGILPIGNGGTGTSTAPVYGQVLVGNSNGTYTLTATSSLGIGGGGGSGTVTSVALSGGTTGLTTSGGPITGSGTITLAGTLAVANGGTGLSSGYNNTNWDTAYGWGNHATAGYFSASNFNSSFDTRLSASSSVSGITTLNNLSILKSQVSDFGTYESPLSFNYPLSRVGNTISTVATSSLNLTTASFVSPNISQWTNNSGYLTSLSGAASSTLLADSNNFSGTNTFTNPITGSVSGTSGNVTGVVAVANGGTGLSSGYNNTNWDTAYGWGNHATAGYFPSASFNFSFDTRLTSTTTLPRLTTLAGLAITKSQVSDFGTYQSSLGSGTPGQVLAYLNGTPSWTATTTYSTGLAYANGAVTNTGVISNAGDWAGTWQTFAPSHFLTSLAGAASSTLLSDSNSFSGTNTFTNPITSTITTGTAPIILASVTKVANLNADLLDGFDSSAFGDATAANQTIILTRIGTNADATTTPAAAASLWAAIKYIAGNMKTNVTAMSAETAGTYTHANAAKYCYDLSAAAAVAMDGNTSTTYTDWRLPTVGEASVFEGTITSANYIWTATVYDPTHYDWINLRLSDGYWISSIYTDVGYVRCVR